MNITIFDDNGDELPLYVTRHSLERFALRYSILYENILNLPYYQRNNIFENCFYKSEQYIDNELTRRDFVKNRSSYYLKWGELLFVIDKTNLFLTTVLCHGQFMHLNKLDNKQVAKIYNLLKGVNNERVLV